MQNIDHFASEVIKLSGLRTGLHDYLKAKMDLVAPNLCALIGEIIGARLISHAGSLTNLAKYPASTVQILGAEKALFRALKTKGTKPRKNIEVMQEAIKEVKKRLKKKKKKAEAKEAAEAEGEAIEEGVVPEKKKKKKKAAEE